METKEAKRQKYVAFRVSEEERAFINEKQKLTGMSLRAFMLACVKRQKIRVIPGADMIAGQIARVGNNLNQLTRHVNSGVLPPECGQILDEIRDEMSQIRSAWQ